METTISFAWTVRQEGEWWLVEQESDIPMAPEAFHTREDAVAYAEYRVRSAKETIRQFHGMAQRNH